MSHTRGYTAEASKWIELLPNGSGFAGAIGFTMQNEGFGNLFFYIDEAVPPSIDARSFVLLRGQVEAVNMDAGDRIFIRSEQTTCDFTVLTDEEPEWLAV